MSKIVSYVSKYWLLAILLLIAGFVVYEYFHVFFGLYWFLVFFTPILIAGFSFYFTGVLKFIFDFVDSKRTVSCVLSFAFFVAAVCWFFLGNDLYYKL